ncbi:uncharacterized protein BJX67DRAFT_382609 [Aspergillus lucknowensis]|uniref:Uncharacterized protein n=1 Tax=Aspergillus lucknowensis TaxID=176173 RepID=A0ABR4LM79_9EURO
MVRDIELFVEATQVAPASFQPRNNQGSPTIGLAYMLPLPQQRTTGVWRLEDGYYTIDTPPGTEDFTVTSVDQMNWSINNLPNILYTINPGIEHRAGVVPVRKTRARLFGKHINDLPTLPPRISSMVEGWRLEAWRRLDPRITPEDVIDRVHPDYRMNISEIEIHRRRAEFRRLFHVSCWDPGFEYTFATVSRALELVGLDPQTNSTRGLTPGLCNPGLGEAGGRIPLPPGFKPPDSHTTIKGAQVLIAHSEDGRAFGMMCSPWGSPYYLATLLVSVAENPEPARQAIVVDEAPIAVPRNGPVFLQDTAAQQVPQDLPMFQPRAIAPPHSLARLVAAGTQDDAAATTGEALDHDDDLRRFALGN